MKNLYDFTLAELSASLVDEGFKAFNARQIFEWLYKKKTTDFDAMTNLSKKLRAHLHSHYVTTDIGVHTVQTATDGTKKYLFVLEDEQVIEAVLMHHPYGKSLCVTTQVGCNIGCAFCASGLKKRIRNLALAEMILQIIKVEAMVNERISHVVLMGTGEPFDNYENCMRFIDTINSPYGLEIGARHITVSTSGIVPRIYDFAQRKTQVNLAISLHATNDRLRTKMMPINAAYPLDALLESVRYYVEKTNRRVTFEYLLLKDVNDSLHDADRLSDLLRGINCYVNLIPYNPVSEFDFKGSPQKRQEAFHKQLLKRGITATLREEKGASIDAACGQLRSKEEK